MPPRSSAACLPRLPAHWPASASADARSSCVGRGPWTSPRWDRAARGSPASAEQIAASRGRLAALKCSAAARSAPTSSAAPVLATRSQQCAAERACASWCPPTASSVLAFDQAVEKAQYGSLCRGSCPPPASLRGKDPATNNHFFFAIANRTETRGVDGEQRALCPTPSWRIFATRLVALVVTTGPYLAARILGRHCSHIPAHLPNPGALHRGVGRHGHGGESSPPCAPSTRILA